jgi:predicted membrane channel-forming protein YqfA (hemolysin III family)
MANNTSAHILGTSANLLGFCLFIITSLHIGDKTESYLIDEFASGVALLLTFSSVLSFISIRSQNKKIEYKLERIADYFFLTALLGIFGIIVFLIINFWGK